jgi:hypothetical protein
VRIVSGKPVKTIEICKVDIEIYGLGKVGTQNFLQDKHDVETQNFVSLRHVYQFCVSTSVALPHVYSLCLYILFSCIRLFLHLSLLWTLGDNWLVKWSSVTFGIAPKVTKRSSQKNASAHTANAGPLF